MGFTHPTKAGCRTRTVLRVSWRFDFVEDQPVALQPRGLGPPGGAIDRLDAQRLAGYVEGAGLVLSTGRFDPRGQAQDTGIGRRSTSLKTISRALPGRT